MQLLVFVVMLGDSAFILYGDKEASDNAMAEIADKFPEFHDYLQCWVIKQSN